MTAGRRTTVRIFGGLAALVWLAFSAPALAQDSDAPVDVTAAPPVSSDTVGPSQLQNFNLQGTVTRPSDRPAATPATPPANASAQPAAPSPAEQVASSGPAGGRPESAVDPAQSRRSIAASPQEDPDGTSPSVVAAAPPSLPLDVTMGSSPPASDADSPGAAAASLSGPEGNWSWPWLAALIALLAGGAFLAWSKRGRDRRHGDPGRMAFAGLVPETDVEPASIPPVRPRPDPVPPRSQPDPRPDPVPPRTPTPKASPPADDGTIKSTALKPQLNVQFAPDRAVVTESEVMLQFDMVLTNSGSAPARDVLVEAILVPAHTGQDQEIAAFFQQPQATGDRMAGIPPFGKISLKSAVKLPLDQLHAFEVEGRKLFVPLIAFNILFRSSAGEGQASASFLVGRGNDQDDKLAPFRLDLGPRIFRGLSARPHSMGLAG